MKNIFIIFITIISPILLIGQVKDIYLGAGNSSPITVTASDNHQLYSGTETAFAHNTVNGNGLIAPKMEASRFLYQAAFGGDSTMVEEVVQIGIEPWIENQFITPPSFYSDTIMKIYNEAKITYETNNPSANYFTRPYDEHMDYAWWQITMSSEDILRQKVAYALSQILVISTHADLSNHALAVANYYDILVRNAFGNFHDILLEASLHPAMGVYLTFFKNDKTNLATNSYPDENYAREIMQLYSIGLDMLNIDGSPILDNNGDRIPTYDNDHVAEFAKIFTGLGAGGITPRVIHVDEPSFGLGFRGTQKDTPMAMYDDHHEQGEKHLLNGYIVPAGQTGMEDIEDAIQHLFDHPNVAPFISYRLIQRLVKSNPTPSFVAEIATIFNNNGSGIKGDLKAVVKAILMHPEARESTWMNNPNQGMLREPTLRKTHFLKTIGLTLSPLNNYWNYYSAFFSETSHHPLRSLTVFNFYKPGFTPNGAIQQAGNVAPEFEIYNSRTSIGFSRQVYRWIEDRIPLRTTGTDGNNKATLALHKLNEKAKDPDALLDHLDVMLTHGNLSQNTRAIIKETLNEFGTSTSDIDARIKLATYLIMISPDYNIFK